MNKEIHTIDKLKPSKYNYLFKDEDRIILYNSLTGKLILGKSKNNKALEEILRRSSFNLNELKKFRYVEKALLDYGFVVDAKKDEDISTSAFFNNKLVNDKTLFLIIMPTEECNLRCVYCYEKFDKGKMEISVQEGIENFISKNIKLYDTVYISWFGGEPLLEVDIIESLSNKIIALCKANNVKYIAGITTNGTLLSPKVFARLLDLNVIDYQITLDGNREIHDVQRIGKNGEPSYDIILNNLHDIKKTTKDFRIVLRTNVCENSKGAMNEYINQMATTFENDCRFLFHFVAVADLDGSTKEVIDLCDTKVLFPIYNYAISKNVKFDFYKSLYRPGKMMCYAANPRSFVIGSDGTIYKCTVGLDNPINHVGQLLQNGTMKLYEDKLDMWIGQGRETSPTCYSCKFSPLCLGKFCPLERISNGKNPCPPFKKNIKDYLKIIKEDYTFDER